MEKTYKPGLEIVEREKKLKDSFNDFMNEKFKLPEYDCYSNFSAENFIELKTLLSDIHNIITMKTTISFVTWLSERLNFTENQKKEIINQIQLTNPNSNGFDVEIQSGIKVIAEVKCNVPINKGSKFGSAQERGIIRDISALAKGKNKSKENTEGYLKFLVLLDLPEVQQATEKLITKLQKKNFSLTTVIPEKPNEFEENSIYIVYVKP